MRKTFLLLLSVMITYTHAFAQDPGKIKCISSSPYINCVGVQQQAEKPTYRIVCSKKLHTSEPLYVIDGVIASIEELKKIHPDNIDSILIVKGPEATTLFGIRGGSGVIVITTKNERTIKIRDAVTGEPIPAATVFLTYGKHKKHSVCLLSDSLGQVSIKGLITDTKYELRVSNIGYETLTTSMNATLKTYSISLQRNYSELKEVVVTSGQVISCRKITCSVAKVHCDCLDEIRIVRSTPVYSMNSKDVERDLKIYPNPVSRSRQVNIEFENVKQGKITLRLFSLDGRSVGAKEYEAIKGTNKMIYSINSQLTSGTYAVQLIDENNKLIRAEKLIIQ